MRHDEGVLTKKKIGLVFNEELLELKSGGTIGGG
jgi:hypothetical protein